MTERAGPAPDWHGPWPGTAPGDSGDPGRPGPQDHPASPGLPGSGPPSPQPGPDWPPGRRPGRWRARRDPRRRPWRRPRGTGPLRRSREDRLVGGVAAGVATRLGWDVTIVRTVFVLAALISGFGAVPYVLAWLLVPAAGDNGAIASKAVTDRRGLTLAAGLASLLIVILLLGSALGASWLGSLLSPWILSLAGLVLIWRNAPADEQDRLRHYAEPLAGLLDGTGRSRPAWRAAIAGLLLLAGLIALLSGHLRVSLLRPLAGVLLIIAAIVVVLGPWWLRIARDLVLERQARARAEERADIASRVHDSVLQTLALIQRRAHEPQQVIQLARAQERELRSWLFDGRAPGSLDGAGLTIASGVRLIQQEVEEQHGIAVEAITVGDCELDDNLGALLAAAREATVNAVKWSGAEVVSVFAEVEPAQVSLFVRDRGRGFDPAAVPADRKGLAESIHARMTRRGGSATVRSAPGEGTEVSLTMPRAAGQRHPSRA
jgi:signal transduction histidine kinase/phage shock protein PspC (stress-responsive transcriptional regulator)